MPKKTLKKKKAYREHLRSMVVDKNLVNDCTGQWVPFDGSKSTHSMLRNGYKR